MERIKNLLNPGHNKDDEVMYGSGNSGDPVHTGESGTGSSNFEAANQQRTSSSSKPTAATESDSGLREPPPSRMPGGFGDDDASNASVKSGVAGDLRSSSLRGQGTHDLSTSNKPLPREPESAGTGVIGSKSTAGPYSSNVGDLDESRGLSGPTAGAGTGMGGSSLPDRSVGNTNNTAGTHDSSNLGRDAAIGSGVVGAGAAAHHHEREKQQLGPDESTTTPDRSFPLGDQSGTSGGTEPYAGPGPQAGPAGGATDQPSAYTAGTGTLGSGVGKEGVYGPDSWKHEHGAHGHDYTGDPCGAEGEKGFVPGTAHFTSGPHALDTANRLDPHVGGTGSSTAPTAGSGVAVTTGGARAVDSSKGPSFGDQKGDHEMARIAALAAGTGAAGVGAGAYGSKREPTSSTTGAPSTSTGSYNEKDPAAFSTGPASTTGGPHKSTLLNKADPRVDSDLSKQQQTRTTPRDTGFSGTGLSSQSNTGDHAYERDTGLPASSTGDYASPYSSSSVDPRLDAGKSGLGSGAPQTAQEPTKDHHYGRDAGFVGAGGAAGYEADKHLSKRNEPSTTSRSKENPIYDNKHGTLMSSQTEPKHHYGRDAGFVGASGAAGYEVDKHLSKRDEPSTASRSKENPIYDNTHGTLMSSQTEPKHYGRDAGLVGAGGGAGYEAEKHLNKKDEPSTLSKSTDNTAYDSTRGVPSSSQDPKYHYGKDTAPTGAAGAAPSKSGPPPTAFEHIDNTGRDAALVGGAGYVGSEVSDKEAKKEHKQLEKQHAKEEKQHEKEVAKAEKQHEKGEKKHGGILGLFHRDKPDKDLKEEQIERQEAEKGHLHTTAPGTGTGTGLGQSAHATGGFGHLEDSSSQAGYERFHPGPESQHGASAPHPGATDQTTSGGFGHLEDSTGAASHERFDPSDHSGSGAHKLHKDPPTGYYEKQGVSTDQPFTSADGSTVDPSSGRPI